MHILAIERAQRAGSDGVSQAIRGRAGNNGGDGCRPIETGDLCFTSTPAGRSFRNGPPISRPMKELRRAAAERRPFKGKRKSAARKWRSCFPGKGRSTSVWGRNCLEPSRCFGW